MSPFFAECSAGAWSFGFKSKIIDRDSATKTKRIVNETTSRKSRTKGGKQRRSELLSCATCLYEGSCSDDVAKANWPAENLAIASKLETSRYGS